MIGFVALDRPDVVNIKVPLYSFSQGTQNHPHHPMHPFQDLLFLGIRDALLARLVIPPNQILGSSIIA